MTEYVPPHVISVLKTYQDKAPRSLHGPGLSLVHPSKAGAATGPGGAIVVGRAETPDHLASQHHALSHHAGEPSGGGGGGGRAGSDEDELPQPRQPMGPPVPGVPIMTTPDPDCGILHMTMLEGKRIGCFLLGGETRLCLPQIFNNILMDFSVEQINRSIQELMIYLYNCTDQQLAEFKRANIIPDTAKSCGLITRTNAERLCSSLLHQAHELRPRLKGGGPGSALLNGSFRVYHRCFGRGEGLFLPELYSYDEQSCIECAECRGLFSPQKFVCHQHEPQEIRTCHWGFNSSNWRSYIHVAESEKNREEHAQVLDKIWLKEREIEQELEAERAFWVARRKAAWEGPIPIKAEPLDIPLKKPKLMNDAGSMYHSSSGSSSSVGSSRTQHYAAQQQQQLLVHPQSHLLHHHQQSQQQTSAAFRPWTAQQKAQKYAQQQQQALLLQQIAPYANGTGTTIVNGTIRPTSPGGSILALSQEPPLLQNPENVVPMSETDKFERSYQPNVALVPRKTILCGKEPPAVSVTAVRERREYDGNKDRSVIKCEVVQIKQESPATPPAIAAGGGAAVDGSMRSVIKCDVQIKQERSGTPASAGSGHLDHGGRGGREDNSRSPGPPSSAHIPVSPPPPAGAIAISTIIAKQQQQQHHHQQVSSMATYGNSNSNSPVPIALDAQHSGSSGSNEITSSTSPLPPPPSSIVVNMNGGGDGVARAREQTGDKPKLVLIKEPIISPPLSTRTPTGRHSPHGHMLQQQQGGGSGHHSQPVSPPPPSHHSEHHQPMYLHHHQVLQQQQQQQQQQQHFRSHHPGTTTADTIIHRNGHPVVGNSEFELSTDTDDDSQTGEPDSSNVPTTMELIGEVLKEVETETKQQILNIFKVLLQESRVEHHRLQMEIRAKEDQLMEVQRHNMEIQRQTDHLQQQNHQLQLELDRALLKIEALREHQHQQSQLHHHQQQQQHHQQQHHIMVRETLGGVGESSTSSTPPSPLSLVSNGSNSNHSHQLIERRNSFPEKSEIIMKPLKKLLRRSPDDATTVLMLASPPPQPTGSLPPALPACLSITATTVSVAPKASSTQSDPEAGRDASRRQPSVSPSPTLRAGESSPPPAALQQPPQPPPPPPPPTSATIVPASPTTITAVSAVNGGSSTASCITQPSSSALENGPSPSPIVVVIPVSSSGGSLPKDASGGCSPRPPSRAGSPRCDGKGRRTPAEGNDSGDDQDEDEPMEESVVATDSSRTVEVSSDAAPEGTAKVSAISAAKGSAIGTSTPSGGASNQENDSPNRSNRGSSGGGTPKSSCDN